MTTIVYHDNVIAFDSRTTINELIITDSRNKLVISKGVKFIMCGAACDQKYLINAYFGDSYNNNAYTHGFIVDGNSVYEASIDEKDGFWKLEITGESRAIGSGYLHAITALDLGCNAVEAVEMAMKRNIRTGGKIRIYKVNQGDEMKHKYNKGKAMKPKKKKGK